MGRQIERILQERGHEITLRVDEQNTRDLDEAHLRSADVALEFTTPATAFDNVARCIGAGTPVVCGTTGWNDRLPEAERLCREQGGALFYASNFCLGVNLMFRFNRRLAAMMARTEFGASITETHHIHKKDAPSGTAITLAEGMAEASAGAGAAGRKVPPTIRRSSASPPFARGRSPASTRSPTTLRTNPSSSRIRLKTAAHLRWVQFLQPSSCAANGASIRWTTCSNKTGYQ